MFIAAPIYMKYESVPVLLNGKPLANAFTINGVQAIKLEDFAKAAGAGVTLEPYFTLRGGTLTAKMSSGGDLKIREAAVVPGQYKEDALKIKIQPAALFRVRKAGIVSSHVFMNEGKAFIPMTDVAKAFGIIINYSNLKPGDSINLNFTVNGDGILGNVQ